MEIKSRSRFNDQQFINKRFGRLFTLKFIKGDKIRKNRYACVCACGAEVEIYCRHVVIGYTKSCGCLRRDVTGSMAKSRMGKKNKQYIRNK